jgi:hypothetical protein
MTDIRGETIERVALALMRELAADPGATFAQDPRGDHVRVAFIEGGNRDFRWLAATALRALIRDEDGRFDVPVELIALGGAEPGSVQSMFKVTIGGVLQHEARRK